VFILHTVSVAPLGMSLAINAVLLRAATRDLVVSTAMADLSDNAFELLLQTTAEYHGVDPSALRGRFDDLSADDFFRLAHMPVAGSSSRSAAWC